MSGRVIFEWPKRGGATLRFTIAEYQGSKFLDIREWVEREGLPLATRKGTTMPLDAMTSAGEAMIAEAGQSSLGGARKALPTVK